MAEEFLGKIGFRWSSDNYASHAHFECWTQRVYDGFVETVQCFLVFSVAAKWDVTFLLGDLAENKPQCGMVAFYRGDDGNGVSAPVILGLHNLEFPASLWCLLVFRLSLKTACL